jgi:hypothetical protein
MKDAKSIHAELVKLAGSIVTHYRDDLLKHDLNIIAASPGTPSLHWSRNTGTHLMMLLPANHESWPAKGETTPYLFGQAGRDHILSQVADVARYFSKGGERVDLCLYFNGTEFEEINKDRAIQIADQYASNVRQEWRDQEEALKYDMLARR